MKPPAFFIPLPSVEVESERRIMAKSIGAGLEPGPHIHAGFTKDRLMLGTLLFMAPLAALGVAAIGWRVLAHLGIALGTAAALHFATVFGERRVTGQVLHPSWLSSLVAGAIVALSLLAVTPYVVTFAITAVALVLKFVQGWIFGRKYLNPAATAKVLLLGLMTAFVGLEKGLMYHPHHLWLDMVSPEGFRGALAWMYADGPFSLGLSLFLWKTHAWIGGVSGLATLLFGIAACWVLRLKWRIPLAFLGGMAVLAVILAGTTGGDPLLRLAFHVFTGSVIFLAFFMATEPQSTPMTERGQYLFGFLLAVLTFVLQLRGVLGGSVIALVALNLFTPVLDRIGIRRAVGEERRARA